MDYKKEELKFLNMKKINLDVVKLRSTSSGNSVFFVTLWHVFDINASYWHIMTKEWKKGFTGEVGSVKVIITP